MNHKKTLFPLIAIVIVLSVIPAAELVLTVLNIGYSTDLFESVEGTRFLTQSSTAVNKYYRTQKGMTNTSTSSFRSDVFLKEKTGMRGVLLGDSAAQGFPYPENVNFSQVLQEALNYSSPNKNVEIINLAASAMSSFTVADMVHKLDPAKPDFILVYSGNNEYYGTFSVADGSNHEMLKLSLFLRNFRIFQVLFDALLPNVVTDENMMERQFASQQYPAQAERDGRVISSFLKNMEEVANWGESRGIPVIFVEPASNIIDMPPFSSHLDDAFRTKIQDLMLLMNPKDRSKFVEILSSLKDNKDFAENGYGSFLMGKHFFSTEGGILLDYFIRAKDLDHTPFRPRSDFLTAYQDWIKKQRGEDKKLGFVSLNQDIARRYSPVYLGNSLFLDHVHYNWTGIQTVANLLYPEVAGRLGYTPEEIKKGVFYFEDGKKLSEDFPFHPLFGERAQLWLTKILLRPPFNTMAVPYLPMENATYPMGIKRDMGAAGIVQKYLLDDSFYQKAFNDYFTAQLAQGNLSGAYESLRSYLFTVPLDGAAYMSLWKFWKLTDQVQKGFPYLAMAEILLKSTESEQKLVKSEKGLLTPVQIKSYESVLNSLTQESEQLPAIPTWARLGLKVEK